MIAQVVLGGQAKRLNFATEFYEEGDSYLKAQAKSPTIVVAQMSEATTNFANKLLASATKVVAAAIEEPNVFVRGL